MLRKKVAVLFGGCSDEYEVSLESAYSVITNMDPNKYETILIGITRQGTWYRYYGSPEGIANDTWADGKCVPAVISPDRNTHGLIEFGDDNIARTRIDVAFPILHGRNGEDGTLQGLLEMAGIPFVGCGTLSSAMCMDKDIAHKVVKAAGIITPRFTALRPGFDESQLLNEIGSLEFPLFVKPANSGSSLGITKVLREDELSGAIDFAFQYDDKVVIEEAVGGFEVGCAVLGNDPLIIGEVDEIEVFHGFLDYADKYTHRISEIHVPARIDSNTAERIKQTASDIYGALECSGFARVDMFLTPEGDIIFNEVNTIPGLTSHSRYPSMLKAAGMTLGDIVDTVIGLAVDR